MSGVRCSRFNGVVVLLLLTAFLLVQADLPISQATVLRPSAAGQCCCSLEKKERGACCCCSRGAQPKSGCLLRASHCGEDQPTSDTTITVKFQVVLPVPTVALLHNVVRKPLLAAAIGRGARPIEPPVPPPRLLIPA